MPRPAPPLGEARDLEMPPLFSFLPPAPAAAMNMVPSEAISERRREHLHDLHCAVMDGHPCFPENQGQISSWLGRRLPSSSSSLQQMSLGFSSVGHLGAEGRKSTDRELGSLGCDLEDFEKVPPARSSSSKRNRTAEVHNLSEKRRRSRINAKMKALQSLIPNSSKTDKVSMLDEAIDYLKQLQLQVQMLSARNSLNQHSMYLHRALQPLQALQLAANFALDAERAMATELGMLPLNQGSSVPNSFNIPTSSHQSIEDVLTRACIAHQQPEARQFTQNRTEN